MQALMSIYCGLVGTSAGRNSGTARMNWLPIGGGLPHLKRLRRGGRPESRDRGPRRVRADCGGELPEALRCAGRSREDEPAAVAGLEAVLVLAHGEGRWRRSPRLPGTSSNAILGTPWRSGQMQASRKRRRCRPSSVSPRAPSWQRQLRRRQPLLRVQRLRRTTPCWLPCRRLPSPGQRACARGRLPPAAPWSAPWWPPCARPPDGALSAVTSFLALLLSSLRAASAGRKCSHHRPLVRNSRNDIYSMV